MNGAILDALAAGFQAYGGYKLDQNPRAQKKEEDTELARLAEIAAERKAKFAASLQPDRIDTFEDTGPDGTTIKRTMRSGYDPERGKYSEEVGSAKVAVVPRNIDPNSPEGIEAKLRFEREKAKLNPAGGGRGSSDKESISFEDYQAMAPEQREAYDRFKGRAIKPDEEGKDRKAVTTEINRVMRDFDKKEAYEQKTVLEQAGIDPKLPDARDRYKMMKRDDFMTDADIDMFKGRVKSGSAEGVSVADGSMERPPSKTPEAPKAPYAEGTMLKGPDGRIYIVRNGEPVPQDS